MSEYDRISSFHGVDFNQVEARAAAPSGGMTIERFLEYAKKNGHVINRDEVRTVTDQWRAQWPALAWAFQGIEERELRALEIWNGGEAFSTEKPRPAELGRLRKGRLRR